jgi:RNA polymerase sigma-70 factor (ECF subfamily)
VLVNSADVEDAVQEALVRAWRYRDDCRSPSARGAWMRQIARNEAYRLLARARPGEELDEDDGKDDESSPDADVIVRRMVIRDAIENLPPEDRALALLRYAADLEQPRIAGLLGIPEGTVKVRLHRIRKRLRPELASIV